MAHIETRAENRASNPRLLLGLASNGIAPMVAGVKTWRRAAASRRAIAEMTPDQLKDIGLEAARPSLDDIKAATLITNLMSMR